MQENFLHFIWQHQYFNKQNLRSTSGEPVNILKTGYYNVMSGPDFSEGKVEIENLIWTGHIEIHLNSSDWDAHKHYKDPAYNNVILHVVWKSDRVIYRQDGSIPTTIELKDRVDHTLIDKYQNLISSPKDILCHNSLHQVPEIIKVSMIERALVSRLKHKSEKVIEMLRNNENDWEETSYQLLAKGFGFKSNANAFYELSKILPVKVVYKHADNLFQLEAMLFGQAGLLTGRPRDEYHRNLRKEYTFLKGKHSLPENVLKAAIWKIGRLRPANFPTVRISQFAAVLFNLKNVFSSFLNAGSIQEIITILRSSPGEYWRDHYVFGEMASKKSFILGKDSANRLIINVVAPLFAAYSIVIDEERYMNYAIEILQQLKPETNSITKRWAELKVIASSAAESQGLIELYNSFCLKKSCLKCNIGTSIIKIR